MTPALLVYDGDCGFCTAAVTRLRNALPRFPKVVASGDITLTDYGLTASDVEQYVWLIDESSGARWKGADVFGALLAGQTSPVQRTAGAVMLSPLAKLVTNHAYRWLSKHRHRLPGGTPACALPTRALE